MIPEYSLEKAEGKDKNLLIKYKLANILDYGTNISTEDKIKIDIYVKDEVTKSLKNYQVIKIDNRIVGCLLLEKYQDGILLSEIYIEKEYQKKKIGTSILNNVINSNAIIYLWVYKENKVAVRLYQKLGFKIIDETESRYFMKYNN